MKVICRMHKTCFYRDICDHSKLHDEIKNTFGNDCVTECTDPIFVHGQYIDCHCDTTMLRKQKLEKLEKLNKK